MPIDQSLVGREFPPAAHRMPYRPRDKPKGWCVSWRAGDVAARPDWPQHRVAKEAIAVLSE